MHNSSFLWLPHPLLPPFSPRSIFFCIFLFILLACFLPTFIIHFLSFVSFFFSFLPCFLFFLSFFLSFFFSPQFFLSIFSSFFAPYLPSLFASYCLPSSRSFFSFIILFFLFWCLRYYLFFLSLLSRQHNLLLRRLGSAHRGLDSRVPRPALSPQERRDCSHPREDLPDWGMEPREAV